MVLSVLSGGLGNQMFQFSIGYRLALKQNSTLILDLSELERDNKRTYSLSNFPVNVRLVKKNILETGWFFKLLNGIPKNWIEIEEKKEFNFDATVLNLKDNVRLKGYWQNPEYFDSIKEDLFKIFKPINTSSIDSTLLEEIQKNSSISIHIRRGDYANDYITNQVHGLLPMSYYQSAIELIESRTGLDNLEIFVFSDDINWCKENFKLRSNIRFIENLDADIELHLMSLCHFNVIANSSFSWWGAYLNQNTDKLVVAPKQWFNKEIHDTSNLTPKDWIRI